MPNRRVVCWIPRPAGSGLSTKSRTAPRTGSSWVDSIGRTYSDATVTRGSPLRWNRDTARTFFSSTRLRRPNGRANMATAAGTIDDKNPSIRSTPSVSADGGGGQYRYVKENRVDRGGPVDDKLKSVMPFAHLW